MSSVPSNEGAALGSRGSMEGGADAPGAGKGVGTTVRLPGASCLGLAVEWSLWACLPGSKPVSAPHWAMLPKGSWAWSGGSSGAGEPALWDGK